MGKGWKINLSMMYLCFCKVPSLIYCLDIHLDHRRRHLGEEKIMHTKSCDDSICQVNSRTSKYSISEGIPATYSLFRALLILYQIQIIICYNRKRLCVGGPQKGMTN